MRTGPERDKLQIAWFLVLELRTLLDLLTQGEHHWNQEPNPGSTHEIVRQYEATANDFEKALASADDAKWERKGGLYFNGKLMKDSPVGETLWDFLFDAVHHRGQLSVYLRPMGGKVPSIYGPSGDTKG